MKQSKINELFGEYRELLPITKDMKEKAGRISDAYDELKEKLTPEQLNYHEKFVEAFENESLEEVEFYFCEGFKLGLLIGIECMEE